MNQQQPFDGRNVTPMRVCRIDQEALVVILRIGKGKRIWAEALAQVLEAERNYFMTMAVGAGFDWVAVSALGRAAIRYYGPGGPAARAPRLAVREDRSHVELGD